MRCWRCPSIIRWSKKGCARRCVMRRRRWRATRKLDPRQCRIALGHELKSRLRRELERTMPEPARHRIRLRMPRFSVLQRQTMDTASQVRSEKWLAKMVQDGQPATYRCRHRKAWLETPGRRPRAQPPAMGQAPDSARKALG